MGEERVQREERDWFESLEPLQAQWNREKNPYGHFLIAQWNWLLASPLSLLLRLAARVSMLLRHNSDTYRQDSWLYTWWGRMARKVVGTKGEGERNSMWLHNEPLGWLAPRKRFHRSYLCDLILRRGDTTMSRKQCDLTREECRLIRLTAMIGCILTLVCFPAFFAILNVEIH